jgi:hypothetical protein
MPLLRVSYIIKYDIYGDSDTVLQSQNYSCIRTDLNIDPLQISFMGTFQPQDISVTDYGEYNQDTGQTFGYCNIGYEGKTMQIIRISQSDYNKLYDHFINKLPNYPLDKPYEWQENI